MWRLGPRLDDPAPTAVGVGTAQDAPALASLTAAGRLAGAVILAPGEGSEGGVLPARRVRAGTARFGDARVTARFTVFDRGAAVIRSELGLHAVREGNVLMLGAGPELWGRLDAFWALEAIAAFLAARLERPLVLLPAIGCVRLDDAPGTAELQLLGARHVRRAPARAVRTMPRWLERSGQRARRGAVAARALRGRRERADARRCGRRSFALTAEAVRAG